jgi:hypothetical protein
MTVATLLTAVRRPYAPRPLGGALLALAAAALVATGCGDPVPDRNAQEGTSVVQGGISYFVQDSRELNPKDPDDRALLTGVRHANRLDGPGQTLIGVFLQAQNEVSGTRGSDPAPVMTSAEGQSYTPITLPRSNPYAYRGGRLGPGDEIPAPDSAAGESTEDGALLVYRLPADIFITDRPFTLAFGTGAQAASVQLDL